MFSIEIKKDQKEKYYLRVLDNKNEFVMSTIDTLEECLKEARYWLSK